MTENYIQIQLEENTIWLKLDLWLRKFNTVCLEVVLYVNFCKSPTFLYLP